EVEIDRLPLALLNGLREIAGVRHLVAVHGEDQVADLEPGLLGRASLKHLADEHAGLFRSAHRLAKLRCRLDHLDTEEGFVPAEDEHTTTPGSVELHLAEALFDVGVLLVEVLEGLVERLLFFGVEGPLPGADAPDGYLALAQLDRELLHLPLAPDV